MNSQIFDELFEQRILVGSKLKECIRDLGYTKVSFASKADISRPTLDKLLNGEINNKSSFNRHLKKILKLLNMTVEDLMLYSSALNKIMSDTEKEQYNLLLDIIDLCTIYYDDVAPK